GRGAWLDTFQFGEIGVDPRREEPGAGGRSRKQLTRGAAATEATRYCEVVLPPASCLLPPASCLVSLRYRCESRQRISVESIFPRSTIPGSVQVTDDLHRNDDAIPSELVALGNAVVKTSIRSNSKLHRSREAIITQ